MAHCPGQRCPKASRPQRFLAMTPGINRRRGAGGGISCAEGDSGPPRDGCEPSWARPCEASGALFLSNGGSGGGHAACTLWPPPAPFGYFPARGKYLVRPQAGETSHKKQISCGRQGKFPLLHFRFTSAPPYPPPPGNTPGRARRSFPAPRRIWPSQSLSFAPGVPA